MNPVAKETKPRMEATIEDFKRKLASIRTGRASVSLLDNIVVDYYNTPTPLNQLATIGAPEAQLLTVQPWDPSILGAIEKAILASDLGITPSNDGRIIRIPIPPLNQERRKQLAKVVRDIAEEHRTAIRNLRRDANDKIKKQLKEKQITEDDEKRALDEIQKLTDQYIEKINDLAKAKENEIMTV
ncbi:MAG: ribosome recycling factor [Acidobacteriota bacterium]|nr:ribosome recycling factor [Blastocatellia bacterium]MDW8412380.1 ribosome recycling factor [Acidobacteriota bacterium]